MSTIRAALLTEGSATFEVADLELQPPQQGELGVRIAATGFCHSDLSIRRGTIPHLFPAVLGHEAAGIVEEVGSGVEGFAPGDHVVLAWLPQCGECFYCRHSQPQLCATSEGTLVGMQQDGSLRRTTPDGTPVFAMCGIGSFAQHAVVPASSAARVPDDLALDRVALIGCAVLTGVGAVLNSARVEAGSTVLVVGVGGVGLNIVQGARIAGAERIIAADVSGEKLELARKLGATHTARSPDESPVALSRDLTDGRGADYTFEAIGRPDTARQAFDATRAGGTTVLIGLAGVDAVLELPLLRMVAREHRLTGSWYGSADIQRDVPRAIELFRTGQLDLDALVTGTGGLEDIEAAAQALESGQAVRTVITP
ncbi:MAG: Zn-dependent alcohol dehydrogenase [Acidimicrobiia bacterium]